ncbi:hypothetical protein HYALB_00008696 [Hymenoscyphus albidus]|uniref:Low temperature requirement A n=1 Tax=Hymenoscyphus albidus TaxID=595503 RepID=A0A9N9LQH0_9HELO|nr:hypothetical protein HYALB_00008696 [Hymenoscyphus albidus]
MSHSRHSKPFLPSDKPQGSKSARKLYNARKEESLRWVVNPLEGLQGKKFKSFHVRHEASMIELFFDLFFVANLATFTSYHEITTSASLLSYVGFFVILWSTWFQITIFDVRFAADSLFERLCKLFQFIFFVLLAVVGFSFAPGSYESVKGYRVYKTLAIVMGISRFFLALQYAIVAVFVVRKHKNLLVPFVLIIATLVASGGALLSTFSHFNDKVVSRAHQIWWIVLPIESILVLVVSSIWRMLSFKESHMAERLSLLTMIIIGEGVIGSTKTAGLIWPTTSKPSVGGVIEMVSIIVMLLLIWTLYFDNHPHGAHMGSIKQQWWAWSHFFLHLGLVGVVEGSNRMAIFFNALRKQKSFLDEVAALCLTNTTVTKATDFVKKINETTQKLRIETYDPRNYDIIQFYLNETLTTTPAGTPDDPGFCEIQNENSYVYNISVYLIKGIYKRFNIDPPEGKKYAEGDYGHTMQTTYAYLWGSVTVSLLMLLVFLFIIRTKKRDFLEYVRLGFRLAVVFLSVGIGCLIFQTKAFTTLITSPFIVTIICAFLFAIVAFDRLIRILGVHHFEQRYAIPPPEKKHGHGDSHDGIGNENHGESYKMHPQATVQQYQPTPSPQGYGAPQQQGYFPNQPGYAQHTGYAR